jgi:hypothetical protein
MATQPRKSFKTEKGTELPLLNLRGREYLQVMHRLVWFKEKYPEGKSIIKTQVIEHQGEGDKEYFIVRAEVFIDSERGPMMVATAHKRECVGAFPDALEKAESGCIGRALAMLGIGTQFAFDDLDEGDRLADSPAPVLEKVTDKPAITPAAVSSGSSRTSFRKTVTPVTASSNDDGI